MLNFNAPFRGSLVLGCLVLASACALAQSDDWHLSNDGAMALFARSAFAHGYMHGYEQGFHNGDVDLQMGRRFHEIRNQEGYRKPHGYHHDFGDRDSFKSGYRQGYSVGYIDAYTGRSFRAIQLVQLAKSENWPATAAKPDKQFDQAFASGYGIGRKVGLRDGRSDAKVTALNSAACGAGLGDSDDISPADCQAYQSGYRLGYSDGYDNQREAGEVFARK